MLSSAQLRAPFCVAGAAPWISWQAQRFLHLGERSQPLTLTHLQSVLVWQRQHLLVIVAVSPVRRLQR